MTAYEIKQQKARVDRERTESGFDPMYSTHEKEIDESTRIDWDSLRDRLAHVNKLKQEGKLSI